MLLSLFFQTTILLAFYHKKEESNTIIIANSSEKIEILLNNWIYNFIEQPFPKTISQIEYSIRKN
ncbi:hypothetical protein EOD40_04515 [Flavobacterium sufflavum]|uniref:Uncharacterized protein n=1 Tax=Flavobacterium sufflavum TaxID=1921138 RepID=A0A3S2U519_9FLAO|nr:hypothetical protein [Flavobacterium sufflavum]RVT78504.1 hypothetical protein EOD40_04515 [Flavobacterium sufflavum]